MSTTIRVRESTKERLANLAAEVGRPMTDLLDEAVDTLERKMFLRRFNARYAELRNDPKAWAEVEAERREWEATLADGLE